MQIAIRKHEPGHLRAEEGLSNIQGTQEADLDPDPHQIAETIGPPIEVTPMDPKLLIILLLITLIIVRKRGIPRKIKITKNTEATTKRGEDKSRPEAELLCILINSEQVQTEI